jgi:hypothetical protein
VLNPFLAGQDLTAGDLTAAFDITRTVYQTADQTRNNSTSLLSSTDLVLSMAINSSYILEACIIYDSNSTADFKYSFSLPTGATIRQTPWGSDIGDTSIHTMILHDAYDTAGFSAGGVAAGTMMSIKPTGRIVMSTTAGNLVVQFAQNVANASDTKLKRDSWLRLTKVS